MDNFKRIAEVTGIPFIEDNFFSMERLRRVAALLTENATDEEILLAEAQVDAQGKLVLESMVKSIAKSVEPVEKVYKIKRSLKGARVKVAGFEGRKFAFGPVWNEQIAARRNYALRDETKVRAHGVYLGVKNAMTLPLTEVVDGICAKLKKA